MSLRRASPLSEFGCSDWASSYPPSSAVGHYSARTIDRANKTERIPMVPELAKEGVGKAAQPAAKQGSTADEQGAEA